MYNITTAENIPTSITSLQKFYKNPLVEYLWSKQQAEWWPQVPMVHAVTEEMK